MSRSEQPDGARAGTVVEEYVLDVRIRELPADDGGHAYRFEAPEHCGKTFDDLETARIYADAYFAANGFQEEGTGELGVPPGVIAAGKDVTVAYLLTRPDASTVWVASYYGTAPHYVELWLDWTRRRAAEIRAEVREDGDTAAAESA